MHRCRDEGYTAFRRKALNAPRRTLVIMRHLSHEAAGLSPETSLTLQKIVTRDRGIWSWSHLRFVP
jgi:hypothetical protein